MIEKDALVGVIEKVCADLDVPYIACRGYMSDAEQHAQAKRCEVMNRLGQTPVVLYLGDHDPSGLDMTRDVDERFKLFMGGLKIRRLALNLDQVRQYQPPPNFAKEKDSRFKSYAKQYGLHSWELDALQPAIIAGLIRSAVEELRDDSKWQAAVESQNRNRERLAFASKNWQKVEAALDQLGSKEG